MQTPALQTVAAPRLVLTRPTGVWLVDDDDFAKALHHHEGMYTHGAGYAFYGGRWHKVGADKPAPKGAPVAAHPAAGGSHAGVAHFSADQWAELKLDASNVNAGPFNKALLKLQEWSDAGNVTAILGAGYGTNTYGKKLATIANHILGLYGSQHKVAAGQKAGDHAGVIKPEGQAAGAGGLPAHLAPKPEAAPDPKFIKGQKVTIDADLQHEKAGQAGEVVDVKSYGTGKNTTYSFSVKTEDGGTEPFQAGEISRSGPVTKVGQPLKVLGAHAKEGGFGSDFDGVAAFPANPSVVAQKLGLPANAFDGGSKITYGVTDTHGRTFDVTKFGGAMKVVASGKNKDAASVHSMVFFIESQPEAVPEKTVSASSLEGKPAYDHLAQAKKAGVMPGAASKAWLADNPGGQAELDAALKELGFNKKPAGTDNDGYENLKPSEPQPVGSFESALALSKKIKPSKNAAADEIDNALFSNYDDKFVIKDADGKVVAAIAYGVNETPGDKSIEVHHIGSASPGAGTKLLNLAKAEAKKQGLPIKLYATSDAIGFYKKSGFTPAVGAPKATVDGGMLMEFGGPKDGDTKPGANGGTLVLKDGHWVLQDKPAEAVVLTADQIKGLQGWLAVGKPITGKPGSYSKLWPTLSAEQKAVVMHAKIPAPAAAPAAPSINPKVKATIDSMIAAGELEYVFKQFGQTSDKLKTVKAYADQKLVAAGYKMDGLSVQTTDVFSFDSAFKSMNGGEWKVYNISDLGEDQDGHAVEVVHLHKLGTPMNGDNLQTIPKDLLQHAIAKGTAKKKAAGTSSWVKTGTAWDDVVEGAEAAAKKGDLSDLADFASEAVGSPTAHGKAALLHIQGLQAPLLMAGGVSAPTGKLSAQQLGNLQSIHWQKLELPASNTNAASVNKKLAAIKDAAFAGDVAALEAMKFGSNTYGKKLALAAQTAIAGLGGDATAAVAVKPQADPVKKKTAHEIASAHIKAQAAAEPTVNSNSAEASGAKVLAAAIADNDLVMLGQLAANGFTAKLKADAAAALEKLKPAPEFAIVGTVKTSLKNTMPGHNKSWSVYTVENAKGNFDLVTEYGKIGGTQQKTVKEFPTHGTAQNAMDKLIGQKINGGYSEKHTDWFHKVQIQKPSSVPAPAAKPATPAPVAMSGSDEALIAGWVASVAAGKAPTFEQSDAVENLSSVDMDAYMDVKIEAASGLLSSMPNGDLDEDHELATAKVDALHVKGLQSKPNNKKPAGPKEGDTKMGVDGLLILKNGHWVKADGRQAFNHESGWAYDPSDPAFSGYPTLMGDGFYMAVSDNGVEYSSVNEDGEVDDAGSIQGTFESVIQGAKDDGLPLPPDAMIDVLLAASKSHGWDGAAGDSYSKSGDSLIAGWSKAVSSGYVPTSAQAKALEDLKDSNEDEYMDVMTSAITSFVPLGTEGNTADEYDSAMTAATNHVHMLHSMGLQSAAKTGKSAVAAPPSGGDTAMVSMDSWKKTGPQAGSNPGGKFVDGDGQEWYCKFPADADTAKSEVLAARLYRLAGMSSQNAKLVTRDGKVGIATKWETLTKASSATALSKVDGVLSGFAVDAWLGNWDVIGMGLDNLQVGADGKAHRVDAGGSLEYRAQGAKKPFGATVDEIDTLRDKAKNPHSAAVFGKMKAADILASVAKVAAIDDAAIRAMVHDFGPGSDADKKAMAATLIARKNDLLAKYPAAAKPKKKALDPTALPIDPAKVPKPHDFSNWNGSGQGLSSKAYVNKANEDVEKSVFELTKAGNMVAVEAFKFSETNKETGAATGKMIPIAQHPSKHVQQYQQDLMQVLDEVANPPQPLKVFRSTEVGSLASLSSAFPPKKFGTTVGKVASNEKLGFWVALGVIGNPNKFKPKETKAYSAGAIHAAKAKHATASKLAKHFISSVQASGSYNGLFRDGKVSDHQGHLLKDVAKAALAHATEMPEGTSLYRWQTIPEQMLGHIMSAKEGTVFQATGPMCTSYDPKSTKGFGKHRVKIVYAKGAKAVDSFASGSFAGEKEVTTLPNARFVILSRAMVPDIEHGNPGSMRLELEVLMLPPDLGIK